MKQPSSERVRHIVAVSAIVAAVVGLFFGISGDDGGDNAWSGGQTDVSDTASPHAASSHGANDDGASHEGGDRSAPLAPTYTQMRDNTIGPNTQLDETFSQLRAFPARTDVVHNTRTWDEGIDAFMTGRAYAGAPPTIPHPINANGAPECMACHGDGLIIEDRIARPLPHPYLTNCTQCHVERAQRFGTPSALAQAPDFEPLGGTSSFSPTLWDAHGTRAWDGAPPVIPHPLTMRETCASCHGTTGWDGLRTSHPERQNCVQCHAINP